MEKTLRTIESGKFGKLIKTIMLASIMSLSISIKVTSDDNLSMGGLLVIGAVGFAFVITYVPLVAVPTAIASWYNKKKNWPDRPTLKTLRSIIQEKENKLPKLLRGSKEWQYLKTSIWKTRKDRAKEDYIKLTNLMDDFVKKHQK